MREEKMICCCFGYSTEDIREDARRHGRSTIMEKIMAGSRLGICNCAANNPKGR